MGCLLCMSALLGSSRMMRFTMIFSSLASQILIRTRPAQIADPGGRRIPFIKPPLLASEPTLGLARPSRHETESQDAE